MSFSDFAIRTTAPNSPTLSSLFSLPSASTSERHTRHPASTTTPGPSQPHSRHLNFVSSTHPSPGIATAMSSGVVRSTALRAGGACVRCRKGKTKCVYENGRAPCKNCAKGMHECYLPSESMAHHHGQSPARHTTASSSHRPARESLPGAGPGASDSSRQAAVGSAAARHVHAASEK